MTTANVNIYCDNLDQHAKAQINLLANHEAFDDGVITIMPDGHAGKVVPIGFVGYSSYQNPIMINAIGNDIGCGVYCVKYKKPKKGLNFDHVDSIIREYVPTGSKIHTNQTYDDIPLHLQGLIPSIKSTFKLPLDYVEDKYFNSLGTLGDGNHFIEIDEDDEDFIYITVHTGSRIIGNIINEYYLKNCSKDERNKNNSYELTCIYDEETKANYLKDVFTATKYAEVNRRLIVHILESKLKLDHRYNFYESMHNYIVNFTTDEKYKPFAIGYFKGSMLSTPMKEVIIPINANEGTIIGRTKYESNFIYLPHGSGRKIMRSEVANNYTVNSYKKMMKGIYSSTISKDTLDEIPTVYRSFNNIEEYLTKYIDNIKILHPIYNFKGGK